MGIPHQLGEDMQVGDLVRRKDTIDPRIGLIRETEIATSTLDKGKLICQVLWHNGQAGHYFSDHLEAVCK